MSLLIAGLRTLVFNLGYSYSSFYFLADYRLFTFQA